MEGRKISLNFNLTCLSSTSLPAVGVRVNALRLIPTISAPGEDGGGVGDLWRWDPRAGDSGTGYSGDLEVWGDLTARGDPGACRYPRTLSPGGDPRGGNHPVPGDQEGDREHPGRGMIGSGEAGASGESIWASITEKLKIKIGTTIWSWNKLMHVLAKK